MKNVNVLIIGAGPAGSVCGYLLRKAGVDCLLVDCATFPRDKVCGGGLTPKAWHLLDELIPELHYDFQIVSRIRASINGKSCIDLAIDDERRTVRVVRRRDFDNLLLQSYIEAGGKFQHATFADFAENPDGSADYPIVVTFRSGEQVACRYLVGADGATSQVRQRIAPTSSHGFLWFEQYQPHPERTTPIMTVALSNHYSHGYYFVFPNQFHDVVGFGDKHTSKERFREVAAAMGTPLLADAPIHGAYIPRSSVVSPSPHVILIGDAGGFPNRASYEGLYYAFATAYNACEAIVTGRDFRKVNKTIFRKKRKEEIMDPLVYNRVFFSILRLIALSPRFVKACYNFFV